MVCSPRKVLRPYDTQLSAEKSPTFRKGHGALRTSTLRNHKTVVLIVIYRVQKTIAFKCDP